MKADQNSPAIAKRLNSMLAVALLLGAGATAALGQTLVDRLDRSYQSMFDEMDMRAEILSSEGMVSRLETSWFPVERCEQLTVDQGSGVPLYLFGSQDAKATPIDLACAIEDQGHRVTGVTDITWGPHFNDRARFVRVRLAGGGVIVVDAQRFASASSESAQAYIGSYQRLWHAETGAVLSLNRDVGSKVAATIDAPVPAFMLGRAPLDLSAIGLDKQGRQLEGGAGNPVTPRVVKTALVDLVQGYYTNAEPTRAGVAWINPITASAAGYTSVSVRGLSCQQDSFDEAECTFDIGILHTTRVVDAGAPGADPNLAIYEPLLNQRRSRWTDASASLRFSDGRWHMAIDHASFVNALRPSDAQFSINGSAASSYNCVSHSLVLGPALASGFGC